METPHQGRISRLANEISQVTQKSSKSKYSSKPSELGHFILSETFSNKCKIGIIVGLPLVSVAILSAMTLVSSIERRAEINTLRRDMGHSEKIRNLIHQLQIERGRSCLYVSSDSADSHHIDLFASLLVSRIATDSAIDRMPVDKESDDQDVWPTEFSSATKFHKILGEVRDKINHQWPCVSLMMWYHQTIEKFSSMLVGEFRVAEEGKLWGNIYGYTTYICAKESIGMMRALGSKYYISGKLNPEELKFYNNLSGASSSAIHISESMGPQTKSMMDRLQEENSDLKRNITQMENGILSGNTTIASMSNGAFWLQQMAQYIDLLHDIEDNITVSVVEQLDQEHFAYTVEVVVTGAIALLCLVVCPIFAGFYVAHAQHMKKLATKAEQLWTDERRTMHLLYQLLPSSIAKQILDGNPVAPENYSLVTVFFSDIVGFTALSSKSTPLQVVNILNRLCTDFDSILDLHDCYKVESIGDGYLIVSGAPKRNHNVHSFEMASVALEVLMMISKFQLPHMPSEKHILIRIGLHTGPIVAGVIGSRAPRYCIFGDTVNTASRMESTGAGMCIQISEDSRNHLRYNHQNDFDIAFRGKQDIKGKGTMKTYWLIGKRNFSYRVDVEEADQMVKAANYWKTNVTNQLYLGDGPHSSTFSNSSVQI